ncbi:site-specific integrase [Sphingomonas xinjiangensis]|uniref:Integrase n=1 Tax=Sphingomonas xinjiangensis TaxID=643568 RepID=A0A840YTT4_9SPHN|nr:site-specific integrase [Sphingomonas xinjiangensis]MBB5713075.1 integrase [Sphingomonas xinjiangensis]
MAFVLSRCSYELDGLGLTRFAHVPFLVLRDMSYPEEANRFLRERALGIWHPNRREATAYGEVVALSANTVRSYANDLKSFITFTERRRLDWRRLSHADLLGSYDKAMSSGQLRSRGSTPLAAATINRRIAIAIEFMLWGGDRALRGPFVVLSSRNGRSRSTGGRGRRTTSGGLIQGRIGIHRQHPSRLRLPSKQELDLWLAEVLARAGPTLHLAIRHIINTGCRLMETALVREWQVPDPDTVDLHRPARMEIFYGAKGGREVGDPDLKGAPRSLRFKRQHLVDLDRYRRLRRKKTLAVFKERNPGEPLPPQLFLSERTGKPITSQAIYRAWHNTATAPFPGWSPHLGRHTFACHTLLELLEEDAQRIKQFVQNQPRAYVVSRVEDLTRVYLRPILGHVDEKTTELYLEWIADHLFVANHRASWSNYLSELEDSTSEYHR